MAKDSDFFLVNSDIEQAPLRDYLQHGYETKQDFRCALRQLVDRWRGRVGERIDERHGFFLLRFHDTPGGKPDEAWLPRYLLQSVAPPDNGNMEGMDEQEQELDKVFGFD